MTSCIHHIYKGAAVSKSKSKSERYISCMKQAFTLNFYGGKKTFFVLIRQKRASPRSLVEILRQRKTSKMTALKFIRRNLNLSLN